VRVHLPGKHALEFEGLDFLRQAGNVSLDLRGGVEIVVAFSQLQELCAVGETAGQAVQAADDRIEPGSFLAQFLRALGIVPDIGLLELALYFLQPFALAFVLKDTP
jgi:hypothetical protein